MTPPKPWARPVQDFVKQVLRERGMSLSQLSEFVYGRSASGKVQGTAQTYGLAGGLMLPTGPTIKRWRAKGIEDRKSVV